MALNVGSFDELTEANVAQARELIAQLVQEDNPAVDLKRGVLYDLLFHYSGVLASVNQTNIDRYTRSSSLLAISADPTLADGDIVDRVLSNWGITRASGDYATGTVTIIVSELATATVPNGAIFEAEGQTFRTQFSYVARTTSSTVQASTDRVLTPLGDGNYSFTVDVVATALGTASMIKKDTLIIPQTQIVNFVKAFATNDFINGLDEETTTQLIARQSEGIAAEAASNRVNMSAMLRKQDGFEGILQSSIIGYGDSEMLRDQHSILPISYGGRADWYVRTQELPQSLGLTKTATLIEKTSDLRGIWQFNLTRDDAPGYYDVRAISLPSDTSFTGSFEITQEIRGTDLTAIGGELLPDIDNIAESSYSRFQTGVVQFKDTETNTSSLSVGATQEYSVSVRTMPLLADIQSFVASRSHRNYAGDILTKAPVPCFLSLAFTLNGAAGATLPDPYTIKTALASYVNNIGFCGRLHASDLSDIIHNYLSSKVSVGAIDMFAQIRRPDGTIKPLRSSEVLVIPNEPENMTTARTVGFILDPADINISAQTVNIPEI